MRSGCARAGEAATAIRWSARPQRWPMTCARAMSRSRRRRNFTGSSSMLRRSRSTRPRPSGCVPRAAASRRGPLAPLQLERERAAAAAAARAAHRDQNALLLLLVEIGAFKDRARLLIEQFVQRWITNGCRRGEGLRQHIIDLSVSDRSKLAARLLAFGHGGSHAEDRRAVPSCKDGCRAFSTSRSSGLLCDQPNAPREHSGGHGVMSDYQVGFIGIGNMGWPMAKNLLKAGHNILKPGHKLSVLDLDKARVAKFVQEEQNAAAADSAAALAKASNVIITMLP